MKTLDCINVGMMALIIILCSFNLSSEAGLLPMKLCHWYETCFNGECVDGTVRCDGNDDCGDNSDEWNCGYHLCSSAEFTCDNGKCVDGTVRCNGNDDCGDNSDEWNCGVRNSVPRFNCSWLNFTCENGECVDGSKRCNRNDDCGDNSDEQNCGVVTRPPSATCSSNDFICENGGCVHHDKTCDNTDDCSDGSDEKGCLNLELTIGVSVGICAVVALIAFVTVVVVYVVIIRKESLDMQHPPASSSGGNPEPTVVETSFTTAPNDYYTLPSLAANNHKNYGEILPSDGRVSRTSSGGSTPLQNF